jgi:hypothetical protein
LYPEELICNLSGLFVNKEIHDYSLYPTVPHLSVDYHLEVSLVVFYDYFFDICLLFGVHGFKGLCCISKRGVKGTRPVYDEKIYELEEGYG